MIEISVKSIWWFAAGGAALVAWFIRLEAKGVNNKTKTDAEIKAINVKLNGHIKSSEDKNDVIFEELKEIKKSTHDTEATVIRIDERLKGSTQ